MPTALYLQEDSWYSFLLDAEGLGKLKKSTSSGLDPTTFQFVA
jgi:hypothetical protein